MEERLYDDFYSYVVLGWFDYTSNKTLAGYSLTNLNKVECLNGLPIEDNVV